MSSADQTRLTLAGAGAPSLMPGGQYCQEVNVGEVNVASVQGGQCWGGQCHYNLQAMRSQKYPKSDESESWLSGIQIPTEPAKLSKTITSFESVTQ